MKPLTLTVNGRSVTATVEPRTHLADFLRETLCLTGTHLGCEHGVCGACTLLIDGVPARSCITYALACEGAAVTTIEGLDDDELGAQLREAFSREHGLQCGYCTPGMLISARDVVLRMPDATEREIRVAMSGNLCRCTGYAGIVRAIERVLAERRAKGLKEPAQPRAALGPAGAGHATATGAGRAAPSSRPPSSARTTATAAATPGGEAVGAPQTTIHESFIVAHPRDRVWAFFSRPAEVAQCLPGTSVLGTPSGDHVDTRMRVRAGPIVAEFEGGADIVRDSGHYSALIRGQAQDARSRSTTRGEIRYALHEAQAGASTRVDVEIGFTLTGPLAQFSRSSLLRDIARRMTEGFARNLQERLSTGESGIGPTGSKDAPPAEIDAGRLFLSALWHRIKSLFGSGR